MTILRVDGAQNIAGIDLEEAAACQMTLADTVMLSGKGLHSGRETVVEMQPAPENTGIVFRHGQNTVSGLAHNVVDTSRGTTIGFNGFRVLTVEHLMAALRGLGVDNAYVEVKGGETPALDGSAAPYVAAIEAVGLVQQSAPRRLITISEPICVRRDDSFILAVPSSELSITYVMDYDHPMIGSQSSAYVLREGGFAKEFAPARTFVLYEEVAGLLDRELAKGGSLDNVIVIWPDRMSSALRFSDELVRHKVVDMIGDLALIGGLLSAEVLAVRTGHALNVEFAREVLRRIETPARSRRRKAAVVRA
ncbi:MAG: UDP-3-O-[3-hydroxymyristoyl] N-acetylglucosamine deacetylase [Armatimonadetes bacterium]|jgi:UDP-3-O-[3-hydroxymyristoyl] N-acetylglucosamine deacetylase|nr:UDP-3-O-[3-hydroxymyristoyl] N-acetylglucosamine deacetylase [Armatimonadota bacterium]